MVPLLVSGLVVALDELPCLVNIKMRDPKASRTGFRGPAVFPGDADQPIPGGRGNFDSFIGGDERRIWTEQDRQERSFQVDGGSILPAWVARRSEVRSDWLIGPGLALTSAGMLFTGDSGRRAEEVSVPLAHQSVLAGVLLAVSFYASRCKNLGAARTLAPQIRYDLSRGGHQELAVPTTTFSGCLCRDPDFRAAYAERWNSGSSGA